MLPVSASNDEVRSLWDCDLSEEGFCGAIALKSSSAVLVSKVPSQLRMYLPILIEAPMEPYLYYQGFVQNLE